MGLDAVVYRNHRDEKLKPFPGYERYVNFDEDGFPYLDLPYEGNEPVFERFEQWVYEEMFESGGIIYYETHIATWNGYRAFLTALDKIGWAHFPILHAYLPDGNEGMMPPEAAYTALEELERFYEKRDKITTPCLVDTETGELIREYNPLRGGVFQRGETINIGLDEDGFFIRESTEEDDLFDLDGRELFRARRVEQRQRENGDVEYYNADDETRFVCRQAVSRFRPDDEGKLTAVRIHLLHVEERPLDIKRFDYILAQLRGVFKAATEVGTPVIWC